jgi:hypothetical protein
MENKQIVKQTTFSIPLEKQLSFKKTGFLIGGSTSHIGNLFLKRVIAQYKEEKGIFRTGRIRSWNNPTHTELDLTNPAAVQEYVKKTNFGNIDELVYIPFVANFKWEPNGIAEGENIEGIDLDVFTTTSVTFQHMVNALEQEIGQKYNSLTVANIGSISRGRSPYWRSFDGAHYQNVKFLQNKCWNNNNIRGAYFFVSSINTPKEILIRPNKPFQERENEWMTAKEVSDIVREEILKTDYMWKEVEIYKFRDNMQTYHNDAQRIYDTWIKDMGAESILLKK